jgi:nitrogen fixation NifU-like protein
MFTPDEYRQLILETARNRQNWGLLNPADFDHAEHNPLCGDHLHLTLRIDAQGVIRQVGWEGDGCAISQASASMLGERLIGMPFADAVKIPAREVLEMIGLPLLPNRQKCALLSLKVLVVGALGQSEWDVVEDLR